MKPCIGLYGVVSYVAARKTNETSIRLALGATRVQVLGSVLKRPKSECSLEVKPPVTSWPANYTLIWTSKNATGLRLTSTTRLPGTPAFFGPPTSKVINTLLYLS